MWHKVKFSETHCSQPTPNHHRRTKLHLWSRRNVGKVAAVWFLMQIMPTSLGQLAAEAQNVLPPDSVLPGSNSSIIFYREGENGYYGNNVTVQPNFLPDSANKAWFDEETLLPGGTLRKFYLMAHIYSTLDDASTRIRLQIWRPVDIINFRMMLVWQQVVQVAASAQAPLIYTYTINQTVALVAGDRIGWAFEGRAGPISFEYTESHRTRPQSTKFTALPQVGQTIDFDPVYLPSIFSVAVSVDGILPGYTGAAGPVGITKASGGPGVTGATDSTEYITYASSVGTDKVISSTVSNGIMPSTSVDESTTYSKESTTGVACTWETGFYVVAGLLGLCILIIIGLVIKIVRNGGIP